MPATLSLFVDPISESSRALVIFTRLFQLPVEVRWVSIKRGEHRTPELSKANPLGKVPFLLDDDGTCVPEACSILTYLAQRFRIQVPEGWYPAELRAKTHVDAGLHWQQRTLRYNTDKLLSERVVRANRSASGAAPAATPGSVPEVSEAQRGVQEALSQLEFVWLADAHGVQQKQRQQPHAQRQAGGMGGSASSPSAAAAAGQPAQSAPPPQQQQQAASPGGKKPDGSGAASAHVPPAEPARAAAAGADTLPNLDQACALDLADLTAKALPDARPASDVGPACGVGAEALEKASGGTQLKGLLAAAVLADLPSGAGLARATDQGPASAFAAPAQEGPRDSTPATAASGTATALHAGHRPGMGGGDGKGSPIASPSGGGAGTGATAVAPSLPPASAVPALAGSFSQPKASGATHEGEPPAFTFMGGGSGPCITDLLCACIVEQLRLLDSVQEKPDFADILKQFPRVRAWMASVEADCRPYFSEVHANLRLSVARAHMVVVQQRGAAAAAGVPCAAGAAPAASAPGPQSTLAGSRAASMSRQQSFTAVTAAANAAAAVAGAAPAHRTAHHHHAADGAATAVGAGGAALGAGPAPSGTSASNLGLGVSLGAGTGAGLPAGARPLSGVPAAAHAVHGPGAGASGGGGGGTIPTCKPSFTPSFPALPTAPHATNTPADTLRAIFNGQPPAVTAAATASGKQPAGSALWQAPTARPVGGLAGLVPGVAAAQGGVPRITSSPSFVLLVPATQGAPVQGGSAPSRGPSSFASKPAG